MSIICTDGYVKSHCTHFRSDQQQRAQVATFLSANVSGRVTLAHELMDLARGPNGPVENFNKQKSCTWM